MTDNAQVHAADGPDVGDLLRSYKETISHLGHWTDQCSVSFDDRRNYWPGKRNDLRKSGADALPWEGASDCESLVISERIQAYVALCMYALNRANIRAYPVESGDAGAAQIVSSFIRWMRDSGIPNLDNTMEEACNFLFEKGHAISYVGWESKDITQMQVFDLEQIAQQAPDMAQMLMDESYDQEMVDMLLSQWPKLKKKAAKKALRKLRKEGYAELPVYLRTVNQPVVEALATDIDIFFPHYCTDPMAAPFCHRRVLMTPSDLLSKVSTEGWDEKWANHLIEKLRGQHTSDIDSKDSAAFLGQFNEGNSDFVEVIYTYQRLMKDGAEGIYCTVWHQSHTGNNAHAKHSLLDGATEYPFVITQLHKDTKRFYDTRSMVDLLRGTQWLVKAERDSRVDRSSLATLPASKGPVGRPKPEFRPGGHVTERRPGEFGWMDPPPADPGSLEVESTMLAQADRMVGLSDPSEDPEAQMKRAFYMDKFLKHVQGVLSECYKAYNRYGPPSVFFRVSGIPEPQEFTKMPTDHEMDLKVQFDIQNSDPESVEKKLTQLLQLVQYDKSGKIDLGKMLEFAAAAIDPVLADTIMRPGDGSEEMAKNVAEDLTMIFAGIEVGARPQGAQVATSIIQQYVQQPDIAERAQNDEAFAARLEKYAGQYQFMMQQAENANIGRLGTEPAAFQGINQQS